MIENHTSLRRSRLLLVLLIGLIAVVSLSTAAGAYEQLQSVFLYPQFNWSPNGQSFDLMSHHTLHFTHIRFLEVAYPINYGTWIYKNYLLNVQAACSRIGPMILTYFDCTNYKTARCMAAEGVWRANSTVLVTPPPGVLLPYGGIHTKRSGPFYANCLPPQQHECVADIEEEEACGVTPIVIDLDGNSFEFSGLDDPVYFDIDGDGEIERIGWTSDRGGDAFLAMDRNSDRVINSGAELFGEATVLADGKLAPNGYVALLEIDDPAYGGNNNRKVDRGDRGFGELLVWLDENHDGISQKHELQKLKKHGIDWISLDYFEAQLEDEHGNRVIFGSPVQLSQGSRTQRVHSADVALIVAD